MQVGLGYIVLDGDPTPLRKGAQQPPPNFEIYGRFACVHVIRGPCLLWPNDCIDQDAICLGQGHIVLDGDNPAPPPPKGHSPIPSFWPMSIVAKRSPVSATAEQLWSILE